MWILSFLLTLQSHIANSAPNQYNILKTHELKLRNWLFLKFKGSCVTVTLVERSAEAKRGHCGATVCREWQAGLRSITCLYRQKVI
jgi:hypothetical protein